MSAKQLAGYLPVAANWKDAQAKIDWCLVGDAKFTAPFFSETIQQHLQRPFNRAFRPLTTVDALLECSKIHDCLKPSGFIFHMSRCGSTLLAQMFAASAQNLVLSEAPPIDRILAAKRFDPNLTEQDHITLLRAMVLSLGQRRHPELQRYIIKFDSWHVRHLDLIQRAFPDVPWIFLYRNPLEVLVSNLEQLAGGTSPGVEEHLPPGIDLLDALTMPVERYVSLVLAHICTGALLQRENTAGLFINYSDLPHVALPEILQHFRIQPSADELAQMLLKTRRHAKQPGSEFKPDSERKQREASPAARHFSDTILTPLYVQLEGVAQSLTRPTFSASN